MQKDKQFYDDFFNRYPVYIHDDPVRFQTVASLLSGRVLDVACGTGTLSDYYSGEYFGVDISDIAIDKARKVRRTSANFMVRSAMNFPTVSSIPFDSIYMGEFLEHIEDDTAVFERMLKILSPKGRIFITVPNGDRVPDGSHCRTFTVASIRRDYSKYGKVRFHNWKGFYQRILFSIEPQNQEKDQVTLVMIVKDEAKGIEKAITSALPLVDRVVVSVDSATRDNTAEIAAMYADELREHVWKNDFSAARNEAQTNVKTRWILFLDGHEYIENFGDIEDKLKFDVDGISVTIRMESGATLKYPRIYRNGIKFKNAVHNINECTTLRYAPNFIIVHDRENLQDAEAAKRRDEQRSMMMPKELQKQIQKNKKDARAHFHLANFHMSQKNRKQAFYHYKKSLKYSKSADQNFVSLLHNGLILFEQGKNFRAYMKFSEALRLFPDRWESKRAMGGFWLTQQNYKRALPLLVDALLPNKRQYIYQPMLLNSAEIWDMIGICFVNLNQPDRAVVAYERAKHHSTDEEQKKLLDEKVRLVKTLIPLKK